MRTDSYLLGYKTALKARFEGRQPLYPTHMRGAEGVAVEDWYNAVEPLGPWLHGYSEGLKTSIPHNDFTKTVKM